mmetsp:Transcript_76587/g.219732  ORF Transcript_76587/g.219732 Transcript_76587/m.219732 type:complete len:280 (-) Transcript_76587:642-1481(-)
MHDLPPTSQPHRPTHPRPASVAITTTFISATGTAAARELSTAPRHRGDHFHHLSSLMHSYSCMHTSGATHRSPLDRWSIGTKGGCLVRPKYHMGDRGGRQTFPRLERMTIRARPALLPSRYGWDTPSLTRLNVLVDAGGLEEAATSIEQWIRGYDHPQPRHRRNVPILAQLWQQCPALQEVIFTLSRWSKESNHEFSQERKSLDWIRIEPAWTVDWSVTRELLLPMVKPVVSAEVPTERPTDLQMDASTGDLSTDRGPTGGSTLSMLSKEVLPGVIIPI